MKKQENFRHKDVCLSREQIFFYFYYVGYLAMILSKILRNFFSSWSDSSTMLLFLYIFCGT